MKYKFSLVLISLAFLSLSSCQKDENDGPPASTATQNSNGPVITCQINGEPFTTVGAPWLKNPIGSEQSFPSSDEVYLYFQGCQLEGQNASACVTVGILTNQDFSDIPLNVPLSSNDSFDPYQPFVVPAVGSYLVVFSDYSQEEIDTSWDDGDGYVNITFTDHDPVSRIISGEFEFIAWDIYETDSYAITEGVFTNIPY